MAAEGRPECEEGRSVCEEGRSVCVGGLPAGLDRERLADKLLIHFLRSRNGGGEITSVNVKEANRSAVITFEDSKVALNVLSHCPHILKVDGREYKLSLSVPGQESSLLNKVILDMSVTIDCSQLPLGEETVQNLCKKYPDLHVKFIKPQRHCTLRGFYSEVQAVLSHLVELLRDFDPQRAARSSSGKDKRVSSGSLEKQEEARPPDSHHGVQVGGMGSLYHEAKASEILLQKPGEGNSVDLPWEQEHSHSSGDRKGWIEEADAEAQSLIMEADVFAYLSSRSEQYKHILLSHGVHVVDATSDGVTTLYLQSDSSARTRSEAAKHMNQARKELSQLYQQLEGNLRRAQVQRSMVGLGGGDTNAFKDLQSLLPKVLLTCDKTHLYIVGESSEVSQAKQMLLLGSGNGHELSSVAQPISCLDARQGSSFSTTLSNCYTSTSEDEATQMHEKKVGSRTAVLKTNLSSTEQKVRGSEGYKLAARFKNSDLGLPGLYPGERGRSKEHRDLTTTMNRLTLASNFEPLPPSRYSLGTSSAVSGDLAGGPQVGPLRVTSAQHSEDILFNNLEPLSFGSPFKTSGSLSSKVSGINSTEFTSTFTPGVRATPSISQNVLAALDTSTLSAYSSTTMSSLKRSSSFSGRPSPKLGAQKTGITERSRPATGSTEKQAKSSSLTKSYTVSKEVIVSTVIWNYIKETYRSRLDAIISDLQVTEILSEKDNVKVILKGPESSEVEECQRKLQKFIGMIDSDFYIQEHQLADLCVAESSEVFKACCSNIRSRFSKILVQSTKNTVLLIGPKSQCLQATEILKEVFFHEVLSSVPPVNNFTHQEPIDEAEVNALAYQTPFQSNRQIRPNETKAYTEGLESSRHKSSQSEAWTVSFSQSPKQNNSGKEKAKDGGPGYLETSKTPRQSPEVSEVEVGTKDDGPTCLSLTTQRKQKSTTTAKQTGQRVRSKSEFPLASQESGLPHHDQTILSSKAMPAEEPSQKVPVHLQQDLTTEEDPKGKVTSKDPKQAQGIQGTMRYAEFSQGLPGYLRYTTAKITYCIPDGIQGVQVFFVTINLENIYFVFVLIVHFSCGPF